ncbi:YggU family protein [Candidatus Dojkabacteria bacterium]|nr:YggU family protein [Candidatus Dojkabacteria bacterium]
MIIKIKVTPSSSCNKIVGWQENTLKIKIRAPAQKGKANKELINFLSKELDIHKSNIRIMRGYKDKNKLLAVDSDKPLKLPARQEKLL